MVEPLLNADIWPARLKPFLRALKFFFGGALIVSVRPRATLHILPKSESAATCHRSKVIVGMCQKKFREDVKLFNG